MSGEIIFVFGLLAITIALFIWDKFRMDVVALLVAVTLAVSGVVSPKEVASGFGASVVVMIAALFIVGEGLFRTGIADMAGQWLFKVGGTNEARLLLFMMPLIALLSAFMSSTGAVALLIPVVLSMSRKSGISPSKLLMPLAFASLVGGMLTLIGTPPNIIVSAQLEQAGFDGFNFFDFTPIGMVILMVTLAYIVFIGRKLLPNNQIQRDQYGNPSVQEMAERYGSQEQFHYISIAEGSALIGETAVSAGLRVNYEAALIGIKRQGGLTSTLLPVMVKTQIQKGDLLCIHASEDNIARFEQNFAIKTVNISNKEREQWLNEFGLAEVMLRRESNLLGKTIQQGEFRKKFGLNVIGLRRDNQPIETQFAETPLKFADSMLVVGAWRYIAKLKERRDFLVLETPAEQETVPAHSSKAPFALAIMAFMLIAMTTGLMPTLTAILVAAFAMIVTGCVTMNEAYKSLNGPSLILIACMLPMAAAMDQTGAALLIVDQLVASLGGYGPLALGAGLFVFTSVFSQFISNTATTVLVAPIAFATAHTLQLNPEPFMMMVAIAASTAFATPIASPVNTLILASGNYKFIDFVKVGVPLQIIAMILTLLITPYIFPFN